FICIHIKYTYTSDNYTLSLHDALPISKVINLRFTLLAPVIQILEYFWLIYSQPNSTYSRIFFKAMFIPKFWSKRKSLVGIFIQRDRKSTRLNSSHVSISYAVFCLKKKT